MDEMKKSFLWPTEIYYFKTKNINNDKIKEIILEKEKKDIEGLSIDQTSNMGESQRSVLDRGSVVGGWQSRQSYNSILEEEGFSEILDYLNECASAIVKDFYREDTNFFMVNSWVNVNKKGNYNIGHIHPNCHWSCAYYVTETYSAPIYFTDPRMRATMCAVSDLQKNPYSYNIGPEKNEPGDAIFFPSWLEHSVANNLTDNPRISISCNFVLHDGNNLFQATGNSKVS